MLAVFGFLEENTIGYGNPVTYEASFIGLIFDGCCIWKTPYSRTGQSVIILIYQLHIVTEVLIL